MLDKGKVTMDKGKAILGNATRTLNNGKPAKDFGKLTLYIENSTLGNRKPALARKKLILDDIKPTLKTDTGQLKNQ